jgi:hypothetical protein
MNNWIIGATSLLLPVLSLFATYLWRARRDDFDPYRTSSFDLRKELVIHHLTDPDQDVDVALTDADFEQVLLGELRSLSKADRNEVLELLFREIWRRKLEPHENGYAR